MITCLKCKTAGLPDEAQFCPICGASICPQEPVKRMTISECRLVPNVIKKGEKCRLFWKGENVKYIEIDNQRYGANDDIMLTPTQSHTYRISFGGEGNSISDEAHVTVKSQYIYGDEGKLMKDGYFKIDLRQVEGKVVCNLVNNIRCTNYRWSVITGEHPVKAYVAEDEKFEVVFDKTGLVTEINFYPGGKFKTDDTEEAYSSIMHIPFGDIKRIKEGWWKNEEYYEWVQFRAQYAQYGIENMTAEQWWKEHDLECLRYLNQYQDVITKHLDADIVQQKIWEKGEWRVRFEGTGGGAEWINY